MTQAEHQAKGEQKSLIIDKEAYQDGKNWVAGIRPFAELESTFQEDSTGELCSDNYFWEGDEYLIFFPNPKITFFWRIKADVQDPRRHSKPYNNVDPLVVRATWLIKKQDGTLRVNFKGPIEDDGTFEIASVSLEDLEQEIHYVAISGRFTDF